MGPPRGWPDRLKLEAKMRKLADDKGAVVEEVPAAEDAKEVEKEKAEAEDKWIPYRGKLEEATFKTKERHFKDSDGTLRTIRETVVAKEGRAQYSVEGTDLLEWRKGRGGTKRRLVCTFKAKFPDTPDGRIRRQKQSSFRSMLRSKNIPGA